jgi:protein-tyrosine phosphatase
VARTILFLCSGNYYRSRFAEIVFNEQAERAELAWRATSAGLTPEGFAGNPGPISVHVIARLARRGIEGPASHRPPRAVTAEMLERADRVVALKEREHRPLLARRFPSFVDRVEFWHVDDVDVAPPSVVLPMLEERVASLVHELARDAAAPLRP